MALFFALGGTSFAAANALLPRNSVGSAQVINNSLQAKDFNKKQRAKLRGLRGVQGVQGTQGIQGPQGLKGDKGDKGDTGTVGAVSTRFFQAPADLADGSNMSYAVFCLAGQQAIAGGGRGDDTLSEHTILTNTRPAISASNTEPPLAGQGFTGWRITVVNPTGGATTGIRPEVWAVCVPAGP